MSKKLDNAKVVALHMAQSQVDPNEAQKVLSFLRSLPENNQGDKLLFPYLQKIVNNGGVVIRSGRTIQYYRDMLAVCERHLQGMSVADMAQTLGWAIRLLRYYRAFPNAEIAPMPAYPSGSSKSYSTVAPTTPEMPVSKPNVPQLPEVGDRFLGKVVAVDETAVLVEIPGFGEDKAIGVIKAEALGGKRFSEGNMARVEVTGVRPLKSGRVIVELKPGAKKESKNDR